VEALCPEEFSFTIQYKNRNKTSELVWLDDGSCGKAFQWIQFLLADALPFSFQKIIVLDVDIRFRSDILSLYKYFALMSETEKVGIAKDWGDLSIETAWYRDRTPRGLQIGEPYPSTQLLNSGVVLLDLEKIRKMNSSSPSLFNVEKIRNYIKEFHIPTWSDQNIYNVIRWKEQNQVYILPCVYNYQTLISKYELKEKDYRPHQFPWCQGCMSADYRFCSGKPKIEQLNHAGNLLGLYPLLYGYNKIFKLSTWCDNSQWTHCF